MKSIAIEDAKALVGQEIGVSEWRTVTQTMIDLFADATDDHQFIHTDPERAARETPYGGTIAHGFLTLSLLSTMIFEAVPRVDGASVGVNFGFDRIRFTNAVRTGWRIATRFRFPPRRKCRLRLHGNRRLLNVNELDLNRVVYKGCRQVNASEM